MSTALEADREHAAKLNLFEPIDGWDTLSGYVLVNGKLTMGLRQNDIEKPYAPAWQMIACARAALPTWEACEIAPAEDYPYPEGTPGTSWRWTRIHPVKDGWGLAAVLVEAVTTLFPIGSWRAGMYPGLCERKMPFVVARTCDDEVVALLAPCTIPTPEMPL